MSTPAVEVSYRALLAVPSLGRVVLGTQVARIAQQMASLGLVLFVLARYGSPELAGLVAFCGLFPGLVVSPVAGALLDRHGRVRLVVLDLSVALVALGVVAGLSVLHLLPPWLLLLIASVASLTGPLSNTGLRSLFPLLVPRHLWERGNAVDANGQLLAGMIGLPLAGAAVQVLGPELSLLGIAGVFGVAAVILRRAPDPPTVVASTGQLGLDAWQGLAYWWRNPTLRGLGFTYMAIGSVGGMLAIALPVLVLQRFQQGPAIVGSLFAVGGAAGAAAGLMAGRIPTEGRERALLAIPALVIGLSVVVLAIAPGLAVAAVAMAISGSMTSVMNVVLITLRQRRTDPAWLGRAFAISGSINTLGGPIRSAVAGPLVSRSLDGALVFGATLGALACVLAWVTIPAHDTSS